MDASHGGVQLPSKYIQGRGNLFILPCPFVTPYPCGSLVLRNMQELKYTGSTVRTTDLLVTENSINRKTEDNFQISLRGFMSVQVNNIIGPTEKKTDEETGRAFGRATV